MSSNPTNDAIEAVIHQATTSTLRDTRTQLFVGNLPYRVRWQDLKDLFRKAGTVLRADVSLGPDNRSRGYGTVLLATAEDAGRAIDMFNGYSWQTRVLEVRADRMGATVNLPHDIDISTPYGILPSDDDYSSTGKCLFVGNLPFHIQWQDLKDLFRTAGSVQRADVALGPDGRSRGFGTVQFADEPSAERALSIFNGYEFNGRILKVHFDKFSSPSQPSLSAYAAFPPSLSTMASIPNNINPTTIPASLLGEGAMSSLNGNGHSPPFGQTHTQRPSYLNISHGTPSMALPTRSIFADFPSNTSNTSDIHTNTSNTSHMDANTNYAENPNTHTHFRTSVLDYISQLTSASTSTTATSAVSAATSSAATSVFDRSTASSRHPSFTSSRRSPFLNEQIPLPLGLGRELPLGFASASAPTTSTSTTSTTAPSIATSSAATSVFDRSAASSRHPSFTSSRRSPFLTSSSAFLSHESPFDVPVVGRARGLKNVGINHVTNSGMGTGMGTGMEYVTSALSALVEDVQAFKFSVPEHDAGGGERCVSSGGGGPSTGRRRESFNVSTGVTSNIGRGGRSQSFGANGAVGRMALGLVQSTFGSTVGSQATSLMGSTVQSVIGSQATSAVGSAIGSRATSAAQSPRTPEARLGGGEENTNADAGALVDEPEESVLISVRRGGSMKGSQSHSTQSQSSTSQHPAHPGPIALPPPSAFPLYGGTSPQHYDMHGQATSPLYHPGMGYVPISPLGHGHPVSPMHHPMYGGGMGVMTPHGLPPITPSMPSFTFQQRQTQTQRQGKDELGGDEQQSESGELKEKPKEKPKENLQKQKKGKDKQKARKGPPPPMTLPSPPIHPMSMPYPYSPYTHPHSPYSQHPHSPYQPHSPYILPHSPYILPHSPYTHPHSPYQPHSPFQHPHSPYQHPHAHLYQYTTIQTPHASHSNPHSHGHPVFSPGVTMTPGAVWGRPGAGGRNANPYITCNPAVGAPVYSGSEDGQREDGREETEDVGYFPPVTTIVGIGDSLKASQ